MIFFFFFNLTLFGFTHLDTHPHTLKQPGVYDCLVQDHLGVTRGTSGTEVSAGLLLTGSNELRFGQVFYKNQ